MKMIFSLLFTIMIATACQKGVETPPVNSIPAETLLNVSYGNDAAHRMDVYLPAGRNIDSTKVIILIHGGGWTEGDKLDFASYIPVLQQKLPGYAIVNINYRLATQTANHFPSQENDVKAAINFLFGKKNDYSISDKYVLLGASAGAHLALLHAYKYTSPVKIKAVVSFFGPTDMAEFYNSQTNPFYQYAIQVLVGGTPTANPVVFQQSSPMYFTDAQSPPTILLHGGNDFLVSSAQSITLKNKLQTAGVANQLVIYPTEGHGWIGANLDDSFNKIELFLKANVQ